MCYKSGMRVRFYSHSRWQMKLRAFYRSVFLVLLPLMIFISPYSSYALFVTDQLNINIVPQDTIFTYLTGREAAIFQFTGTVVDDPTNIFVIDYIIVSDLTTGSHSFFIKTTPADPCVPTDPMFFAFLGTANTDIASFIAQAREYVVTSVFNLTPPPIYIGTIGTKLNNLHMTGPIYAFDEALQKRYLGSHSYTSSWALNLIPSGGRLAGVGVISRKLRK